MELWIRSQDKEVLSKINNIKLVEYNGQFSIVGYYEREVDDFDLGIYMSKERALEVLDEIQKFIERGCKEYKSNGDYYTSKYEYSVFQMPQD